MITDDQRKEIKILNQLGKILFELITQPKSQFNNIPYYYDMITFVLLSNNHSY